MAPKIVWREARKHRPLLKLNHIPGLRTIPVGFLPSSRLAIFVNTLGLDPGETAALTIAEQHKMLMFLTDDSAARFAGEALGLRVHGTIGILLRAIRRGLRSRSEVLDILGNIRERSSLHLAPNLLHEVVAKVTEG